MSDPATLCQSRTQSIHESFHHILQQPHSTRSKFPFSSTPSAFKKLGPQNLDELKSQEIVRLAVYVMKRSHLDFADPLTGERVHVEGENILKQDLESRGNNGDHLSRNRGTAASEIYLSNNFNVGTSVLHNSSYPTTRHVRSLITIAIFCARASALRRRSRSESGREGPVSPTASALDLASASMAGSKWLAKLGQIMFGGLCAQAGHAHHRRTRASLELLERQNIELGQHILAEQQYLQQQQHRQRQQQPIVLTTREDTVPASVHSRPYPPGPVSPSISTSALSATITSTSTHTSSTGTPIHDRWCRHCSKAMSCLVVAAVREFEGGLAGAQDLTASFEDSGFANASSSSAFDTLNTINSLSSSTSSLGGMGRVDRHPRLEHRSDSQQHSGHISTPPNIAFDRSYEYDDDMIHPKVSSRSGNGAMPTESSQQGRWHLSESLADVFGSELAAAVSTDRSVSRGSTSSTSSTSSKLKKLIMQHASGLQLPLTDESDLELVSRTGSALPSMVTSIESSLAASRVGSWQGVSPVAEESRSQSQRSPRPVPLRTGSSGPSKPSRTRLEMDLAEAVATPSPGSVSSLSSVTAATVIGIHPSLESLTSSSGSLRRSLSSSRALSTGDETIEDDATIAKSKVANEDTEAGAAGTQSLDLPTGSGGDEDQQDEPLASSSVIASRSSASSPPSSSPSPSSPSPSSSTESTKAPSRQVAPESPSPSDSGSSLSSVRQQTQQGRQVKVNEAVSSEHHLFYALGIHGQTSTDSYAREIEDSMTRTPPPESGRSSIALSRADSSESNATDSENGDKGHTDEEDTIRSTRLEHNGELMGIAGESTPSEKEEEEEEDVSISQYTEPSGKSSREALVARSPSPTEMDEDVEEDAVHGHSEQQVSKREDIVPDSDDSGSDEQSSSPSTSVPVRSSKTLRPCQEEEEDNIKDPGQPRPDSESARPRSFASGSTLLTDDSSRQDDEDEDEDGEDDDDYDEDEEDDGEDEEDDGEDEEDDGEDFQSRSPLLSDQPLTRQERRQEQQQQKRLRRRKRHLLVDDAKRKQDQLDRIKAQLELKTLGKIRQQVSFWEEKGVLEQKVVAVVEVEEEEEEKEPLCSDLGQDLRSDGTQMAKAETKAGKDIETSSAEHSFTPQMQEQERNHAPLDGAGGGRAMDKSTRKITIGEDESAEPLSPSDSSQSPHDEQPKPAPRDHGLASSSDRNELDVFLSDVE
ncbi:hypothetical protein BGX28_006721 [Mortierella sp. GBA30]|nr:hypothetical protein BGX28_006721 [Mortierella sp. GBA30]